MTDFKRTPKQVKIAKRQRVKGSGAKQDQHPQGPQARAAQVSTRTRERAHWDTDGNGIGGHAPYCVCPLHSTVYYCSADPSEPDTMRGLPSKAWKRDHPDMKDQIPYMQTELNRTPDGTYAVVVPTRYVIERQTCFSTSMPGDEDFDEEKGIREVPYASWHVWDTVRDDYAATTDGQDGSHFDSMAEAQEWITNGMRRAKLV